MKYYGYASLEYKKELIRKTIHISTASIAILYYYFDKPVILSISLFFSIGFLTADLLRLNSQRLEKYFHLFFSKLLRNREVTKDLTGASYLFMGITITIFLFSKNVAIVSILILTISDTVAAIAGKKFGRNKIGNKSVEGSIAFFISTIIIIGSLLKLNIFYVIFVSILITFVEAVPIRINDNLTIPVFSGLLLTILY